MFKINTSILFIAGYLLRLLLPLIPYPIILHKFNIYQINFYLLLFLISSISMSVQSGFMSSFSRYLAYTYSGNSISQISVISSTFRKQATKINLRDFAGVFSVSKTVYLYLTFLHVLLLVVLSIIFLQRPIAELSDQFEGYLSVCILILTSGINLYLNLFSIYLTAIQRVNTIQVQNIISGIITFTVLIVSINFITKLYHLIILIQLGSLLTSGLILYKAIFARNKLLKSLWNVQYESKYFKLIWGESKKSAISTLFAGITSNVSGLMVNSFFSPIVSISFLLTKKVFDIIGELAMTPFNSYIPDFSILRSSGDITSFNYKVKYYLSTSYFFLISASICFIYFNPIIIKLFNWKIAFLNTYELWLFLFYLLISRWSGVMLFVSNISNKVIEHKNIFTNLVFLIFGIYLFYNQISVEVLLYLLILGQLFSSTYIVAETYSMINTNFWDFEKKTTIPIFFIILIIILLYKI
jgi:hypothetical protein